MEAQAQLPIVGIVSGHNQVVMLGREALEPLKVQMILGGTFLTNESVEFRVSSGDATYEVSWVGMQENIGFEDIHFDTNFDKEFEHSGDHENGKRKKNNRRSLLL